MRILAAAFLCLALAACSTSEPRAATAPTAKGKPEPAPASPAGNSGATPPGASPAVASAAALAKQGEAIYQSTCATCHMADGGGVPFLQPSIRNSGWISAEDPQPLLSLILRGSRILGEASQAYDNDMAPQEHLSDAEIAAVATYVRQRFAAAPIARPVTPAEVAIARRRPGLPE